MRLALLSVILLALCLAVVSQTPTLGLSDGFISFNTSSFSVQLVKDSQTLYSLAPTDGGGFDFIPADQMTLRQYDGNYHLGDVTFRARVVGSSAWISVDTAASRDIVEALPTQGSTLAAASLAPTLPSGALLNITRRWTVDNGSFQLLFDVANSQESSVEIGALGLPLEFNNVGRLI